ncbi:YeeE/YedE family protein [Aliiroseovarius sediminis]|uniref:YeeE/YedE family protein n=1 Tax=Aliiroseovarius sediminis TaxID=2925839 RepID=UPI001F59C4C0|nr:YeeE/YedE family protein [Aliiroseovarius sediminis]MCI2393628.1 YeeE/YedE family protein [Aliiroseovarius sediminis]
MKLVLTYLVGVVFGLGIAISGMANPAKVLNFFDVFGAWDPSLAFVMGAALLVATPGYMLVFKREKPAFAKSFKLPGTKLIDRKLVLGSFTFGLGWGLAGFCPGAALPVISTGNPSVLIFTVSMIVGLFLARWMISVTARRQDAAQAN